MVSVSRHNHVDVWKRPFYIFHSARPCRNVGIAQITLACIHSFDQAASEQHLFMGGIPDNVVPGMPFSEEFCKHPGITYRQTKECPCCERPAVLPDNRRGNASELQLLRCTQAFLRSIGSIPPHFDRWSAYRKQRPPSHGGPQDRCREHTRNRSSV